MQYSKKTFRTVVAATMLSAMLITGASAARLGTAVVDGDTLTLRESATTASDRLAVAAKGDKVLITGDPVLNEAGETWYPVQYGTKDGYMRSDYLLVALDNGTVLDRGVATTADALGADTTIYGYVTASSLNLRTAASTEAEKIGSAPTGALVEILDFVNVNEDEGWYQIVYDGVTAYVSAEYVMYDVDPSVPYSEIVTSGSRVLDVAVQYLGCRYSYGSSGPNAFDCSGFTSYVYRQLGITLNRSASGQTQNGTYVSRSELQPGDLVLFRHHGSSKAATHVGIYAGGGQFIHASTNDYTVRYDSLDSAYYSGIFIGGRHIL